MKRLLTILACAALLIGADVLRPPAETATDGVRRPLETVLALVWDPALGGLDVTARRAAVRKIADGLFDWPEMARRAVGPRWPRFTANERRDFAASFARLLERAYLWRLDAFSADRMAEFLGDREAAGRIRWVGETQDRDETIVHAVLTRHQDLPVDFRVRRQGGRWRVFDVAFDRVSVVANYRAQFDRVLGQGTPGDLVDLVARRLDEAEATASASVGARQPAP